MKTNTWREVAIGEVADVIGGGTPSSKIDEYWGGDVPWLAPKDLSGYPFRRIGSGARNITSLGLSKSGAKILPKNSILITSRAPVGYVAIADNEISTNQGFKSLVLNGGHDPEFFYYLIKYNVPKLEAASSGTTFKEISGNTLKQIRLRVPGLEEQRAIAQILGSFDDKIELNQRMNETLEGMAQALFKGWFVDFEPVKAKMAVLKAGGTAKQAELAAMSAISGKDKAALKRLQTEQPKAYAELAQTAALFPSVMEDSELGQIPEGWTTPKIRDVAKIVRGKSYKSSELEESSTALVTLKSFHRGGGYRLDGLKEFTGNYKPEQEVFAGDLIVAYTDVTQAADVIGQSAVVIGNSKYEHLVISLDVAVIRPLNDQLKHYLYGVTATKNFQQHNKAHATGTTVLHLSKEAVPEYQFVQAGDDLMRVYAQYAKPIFSNIDKNINKINNLENFRDTLLPKLISGTIRASNAKEEKRNDY